MNKTKDLKFKDKSNFVYHACQMYMKVKTSKSIFEEQGIKSRKNIKFTSMFEGVISLLNDGEKAVYKNDFLDEKSNSNWYLSYWSKSTYYKKKHEFVEKFIRSFFS
ncbi:MAG: hypothetical protein KAG14_02960 [Mycoplasmataceae bacterium]|nr:hypothetical protein [Mycoplasmataceae bacterium]